MSEKAVDSFEIFWEKEFSGEKCCDVRVLSKFTGGTDIIRTAVLPTLFLCKTVNLGEAHNSVNFFLFSLPSDR